MVQDSLKPLLHLSSCFGQMLFPGAQTGLPEMLPPVLDHLKNLLALSKFFRWSPAQDHHVQNMAQRPF